MNGKQVRAMVLALPWAVLLAPCAVALRYDIAPAKNEVAQHAASQLALPSLLTLTSQLKRQPAVPMVVPPVPVLPGRVAEKPAAAAKVPWEERLKLRMDNLWGKMHDEAWDQKAYWQYAIQATASWAIFVILGLFVWAFMYPTDIELSQTFRDPQNDPVNTFNTKHFGCFDTPGITLWACFCPCLRWADTVSLAGFIGASMALAAFFFCALLNGLTYGAWIIYGFFTCILILYYRHKLRAKLDISNWTCGSCCLDFLYVFCCTCCAIAQEARVVQYAYQQGMMKNPDDPSANIRTRAAPAPAAQANIYAYRSQIPQPVYGSQPLAAGLSPGYRTMPSSAPVLTTTRVALPMSQSTLRQQQTTRWN